jgi:integrase
MRDLCNAFLTSKRNRLDTGELSSHTFAKYYETCDLLIGHFGRECCVDDLRPDDFEFFRGALAIGCGVVTLKSKINRCRVVLKYASDNRLIDHSVQYGRSFDRPSAKVLRQARNEAGKKMFEADELRHIIGAASEPLRTMVLLGINCGFGNTDVATLPQSAVDFETGWIDFPRPKTAVKRRIPLWPETVKSLRNAVVTRPHPKDVSDSELCFLTIRGTRFVRVQESKRTQGRHVTINSLSRRFESVLKKLDLNRNRNFYALRHTFATIAGESKDQVAVNAIMGHVDSSMGAVYRERISDERLQDVVETVRRWLWPDDTGGEEG